MFINMLYKRNIECNYTGSVKPHYTESDNSTLPWF